MLFAFLRCSNIGWINLGDDYYLDTWESNCFTLCAPNGTVLVNMHILDYNYDSKFIIVAQRPWDSVPEAKSVQYGRDRIFNQSSFVQYWIINKKEDVVSHFDTVAFRGYYENVYGPFKREEYLEEREKLGVPDSLKLPKYDL